MVLPALLIIVAFTHYPIIMSVISSARDRDGNPSTENYERLISDPVFWSVLRNNFLYALGTVPISIAIALGMALLVNGRLRGKAFARLAYFTPTVLPMVAVGSIWLLAFSPGIGPFDRLTQMLGIPFNNWLGDSRSALLAVMIVMVWKLAGFFMIFFLAGLQAISPELREASNVEGASAFYHFRRVTLPLLMPTMLFVLIVAFADAFKIVDHLFIMTGGGPNNASNLLLYYIYDTAFTYFDPAYAGALTVALVVILAGAAIIQFGVLEKRVHYR